MTIKAWSRLYAVAVAAAALVAPCSAVAAAPPVLLAKATVVNQEESIAPRLTNTYFNVPTAFQFVSSARAAYSPYASRAVDVQDFTDETKLERAVSSGLLAPGTRAVLYDDEMWSLTPAAQQQDPATYYQHAAAAAHAAGLLLIAAPGTDLANVVNPGSGPAWQRFVASRLPASIAQDADVYIVQSQSLEANLSSYDSYVEQASTEASDTNPNVELLSGVSTNPSGHAQTAQTMLNAALSVAPSVSGWWLNDPVASIACPTCTGPYPWRVVKFLRGL